jgi:cysteinyl-tRNA synthetase
MAQSSHSKVTLYNTLTRSLEPFQPLDEHRVSLYTCGPTVYDYQHIGNYSAYVRWDTLVRVLQASDYIVDWVMNITDVGHLVSDADEGEDKLEKGARREGKTAWEVAQFYMDDFLKGLHSLNIQRPTYVVRATDHIAEQISLIQALESKGYTYIIDDGVYFDTSKFPHYGELARLDIAGLQAGARVEMNQQKRNITDFALWKFTPKGTKRDMEWESPWGTGFPGWHIECSAMSMKYLGETIDIHTGGIDHLPVHHVNEVAQSEAATGKQFVKYWLHCNHLLIDDQKIAKSTGNGILLCQLEEEGFSPLDIRMLLLQSHYRTQANFTQGGLAAARTRRLHLQAIADLRYQTSENTSLIPSLDYARYGETLLHVLQDDLNSPKALSLLSEVETAIEKQGIGDLEALTTFLIQVDNLLGLGLLESQDITPEQRALITERNKARSTKDFTRSDQLRDDLLKQGIELRDTAEGALWSRI